MHLVGVCNAHTYVLWKRASLKDFIKEGLRTTFLILECDR